MNTVIEIRGLEATERSYHLAVAGGFAGDVVDRLNDLSRDPEQHEAVVSLGNAALRGLDDSVPGAERHKDDITRVISDIDRTVQPREMDEQDRFYLAALAIGRDPEDFLKLYDDGADEDYRERVREVADKRRVEQARNFEYAQNFRVLYDFLKEYPLLSDNEGFHSQYENLARTARKQLGLEE